MFDFELIDGFVKKGFIPPDQVSTCRNLVRYFSRSNYKSPNVTRIIAGAILLEDEDVVVGIIRHVYCEDFSAYQRQKSAGMSKYDLAYKPTMGTSFNFIKNRLIGYLESIDAGTNKKSRILKGFQHIWDTTE